MGLGGVGWGGGRDFLEEESSSASSSQDADDSPGRNGLGILGWDLRATELKSYLALRRRAEIWPLGNTVGKVWPE